MENYERVIMECISGDTPRQKYLNLMDRPLWIKCSERLPPTADFYYCKIEVGLEELRAIVEFGNNGSWDELDSRIFKENYFITEWLDD